MKNKNKGNIQKIFGNLSKLVFFPIYLFIALIKLIVKKIGFSIRLKLSLIYIKKLLSAMIWACLGVVIVFGTIKIYDVVSYDHISISKILSENNLNYLDLKEYSQEYKSHVLLYDMDRHLLYETKTGLAEYGYKEFLGVVKTDNNLFLAINRTALSSPENFKVVIYTDVEDEVFEILKLSRIILYVFLIVSLFSIISIARSGKGVFQPIREMTDIVRGISENNLNLRLNIGGSKDELKELAITFNDMMNRIEEDYNRQKQFVSDASHELRTPIAVIQGYVDMLNRWGKNDKEVLQESIDAIKNESENMKDLVNKLLFLARNDRGTLIFQKEEFSLTEMLIETVKETQIIDGSHRINYDIKKEISLYADRKRIKQAVRIFIDNAIKYTPNEGEITISLNNDNNYISISIKDTGIGMSKQELKSAFNRFYRSDKSRTKEKGGHGLGLAIAKIIIFGHNGKIKVRSKPSEGSEFKILLKI